MTANAIAISREPVSKGFDRKQADAIAEVVVTRSDEHSASKADVVEIKAEIKADREAQSDMKSRMDRMESDVSEIKTEIAGLKAKINILMGMNVAILLFLLTNAIGGA